MILKWFYLGSEEKTLSLHFKAQLEQQDCTHKPERLKTKWYARMWIKARVYVCVCQRSAACVGSRRVNCESRLATAGSVAGVEGVSLVLCGQPRFQLNQAPTLIPAPHTVRHTRGSAERGHTRSAGLLHDPACQLPLWLYSKVSPGSEDINISALWRGLRASTHVLKQNRLYSDEI